MSALLRGGPAILATAARLLSPKTRFKLSASASLTFESTFFPIVSHAKRCWWIASLDDIVRNAIRLAHVTHSTCLRARWRPLRDSPCARDYAGRRQPMGDGHPANPGRPLPRHRACHQWRRHLRGVAFRRFVGPNRRPHVASPKRAPLGRPLALRTHAACRGRFSQGTPLSGSSCAPGLLCFRSVGVRGS